MKENIARHLIPFLPLLLILGFSIPTQAGDQQPDQKSEPPMAKATLYDLPITFTTDTGKKVTLNHWKGRPLVVTMAFTTCQFACPRMMESLKKLQKAFDEKKRDADFLIISLDPESDTVKTLTKYRANQNLTFKNWTFLTGKESNTRQISMVLGIRYNKNPESGSISHDNKILLINTKGEIEKELLGLNINPQDAF